MAVLTETDVSRNFMAIYQLGEYAPEIDSSSYVTDSANIIGKVRVEANASIWFDVTIRGDNELITVGENSNVQEGCILHTDPGYPLSIGQNVTIGHQAMLHGCTIGGGSLVGIQAVILNGAKIGRNCLVGAGALITEGKEFPDNSLIIGSPAKAVRTLSEEDIARMHGNTANYVKRGQLFKRELKRIG
jgi:carbonic anhydrase/acetyltransferase-like protein (isoleucine patch superfamily)